MQKFLFWASGYLPCRLIYEDGESGGRPYLQRYYVCRFFGVRVYLHRFVSSDPDRGLHSHPWAWAMSLILSGHYFEERFSGELTFPPAVRKVTWFNFLVGENHHRVVVPRDYWQRQHTEATRGFILDIDEEYAELAEYNMAAAPAECWSLFIHRAQRVRTWGFLRKDGDGFRFSPYRYPGGEMNSGEWWKTAPRGRQIEGR